MEIDIHLLDVASFGYTDTVLIMLVTACCIFSKQVGGTEEYLICDAITSGRITKPLVSWCIGTCGTMFTSEVTLYIVRHIMVFRPQYG